MSNQKPYIILLGVVALAILSWGFYLVAIGNPVFGIILLVLGIAVLVWLWGLWRRASKA